MFIDLLRNRRSFRKFEDKPVEKEKIDLIVEAALRSPSSRNKRPWEFIIIDQKETLIKLSHSKPHGASFLKNAPLGIVVCGEGSIDTWIEDCSIACTFIKLAGESVGLKSCWIQIREREHDEHTSARDYIAEILKIPHHLNIEAIIALGYPEGAQPGHPNDSLLHNKVKLNVFTETYE